MGRRETVHLPFDIGRLSFLVRLIGIKGRVFVYRLKIEQILNAWLRMKVTIQEVQHASFLALLMADFSDRAMWQTESHRTGSSHSRLPRVAPARSILRMLPPRGIPSSSSRGSPLEKYGPSLVFGALVPPMTPTLPAPMMRKTVRTTTTAVAARSNHFDGDHPRPTEESA
jgi:hypothetical protein